MASRAARSASLASYVLHHYDWSESSVILDLFTREQGRIAVAAKGAKQAVLAAAQRAAAVPAAAGLARPHAVRRRIPRGAHAARRRLGRRPPDAERRRAVQRLLPERAADEAARPPRSARARSSTPTPPRSPRWPRATRPAPRRRCARSSSSSCARSACCPTSAPRPRRTGRCAPRAATSSSPTPASSRPHDENEATVSGATLSALEMALGADLPSLQRVAATALAALRPLLRAQLHYHLGTSQLRTRQVMIEAQALDR